MNVDADARAGWRAPAGATARWLRSSGVDLLRSAGILLPFLALFAVPLDHELVVRHEGEHAEHPRSAIGDAHHRGGRHPRARGGRHRPLGRCRLFLCRRHRCALRPADDRCWRFSSASAPGVLVGLANGLVTTVLRINALIAYARDGVHHRRLREPRYEGKPARPVRQAGLLGSSPGLSSSASGRRSGSWSLVGDRHRHPSRPDDVRPLHVRGWRQRSRRRAWPGSGSMPSAS